MESTQTDKMRVSFSVGATQHSQINRSELVDWPVLQLERRPVWVESLDSTVDIVQVGAVHTRGANASHRLMKPAIICEARLGTDRHQEEEKTARLNLAFVARRLAIRRMRFTSSS
jgi:hypothetical protein